MDKLFNKGKDAPERIDPLFLVTEKEDRKIESFFIGLGVIFNDLKGLLLFEDMLINTYKRPVGEDATIQAGHYSGTLVQIQKLVAATTHEFFIFLKKNTSTFTELEFKQVLDKLSKSDRQIWNNLLAVAHGKLPAAETLSRTLVLIRSNMTFHYDHSGKVLKGAFISRYFGDLKIPKNKDAYYSIEDNILDTHFYFADAAVEEALYIAAGKKQKKGDMRELEEFQKEFQAEIIGTVGVICSTIKSLMKVYIKHRRNYPRG